MSTAKKSFHFEEFYRAFSKSVPADVTFANGELQVVRYDEGSNQPRTESRGNSHTVLAPLAPATSAQATARPGSSKPVAVDFPLPECVAALVDLQEPDGSWHYSQAFQYVLNEVVPPPPENISGKLWATSICINVWRQFPEYFAQLEAHYDRAMLHANDAVLQRVKSQIDFESLRNVSVCVTKSKDWRRTDPPCVCIDPQV